MRRLAAALGAGILLTACSAYPLDPYPFNGQGPGATFSAPLALGGRTETTVLYLAARPGDVIELLSAEPIGLADGAEATFYFSPPVMKPTGERVIGEARQELEGATFTNHTGDDSPDNTVGVDAEITADAPGRYELTGVRLRYRINGGPELVGETIDVILVVCADDPKPMTCDPE